MFPNATNNVTPRYEDLINELSIATRQIETKRNSIKYLQELLSEAKDEEKRYSRTIDAICNEIMIHYPDKATQPLSYLQDSSIKDYYQNKDSSSKQSQITH